MALSRPQRMLPAPPRVEVIWGPPGSGKSFVANQRALAVCAERGWKPEDDIFHVSKGDTSSVYFDGYVGQRVMIFNDYYSYLSRSLLQRMLDVWPGVVDTKGGSFSFMGEVFFFTSNQHPSKWYSKMPDGLGAVARRLTLVEYKDYSEQAPCPMCKDEPGYKFPHGPRCAFTPDSLAPAGASRGPRSIEGYIAADGSFIPL